MPAYFEWMRRGGRLSFFRLLPCTSADFKARIVRRDNETGAGIEAGRGKLEETLVFFPCDTP